MAEASVSFLLDNLKQLLNYHINLISDVKPQLEQLEKDLVIFQAFLKENNTKKRRRNEVLREVIKQIQDVVYDAEDVVDEVVTLAAEHKQELMDYFKKPFKKPLDLHDIAIKVKEVKSQIDDLYGSKSFALIGATDPVPDDEENKAPDVREENIVGFEDEEEKLLGYLREETKRLDVISIIGMPGLGKTTLAGMIFRNPEILYEFPTRIWVYVSQEFNRKNVLLAILKEILTSVTDDMVNKTETQLAKQVAENLAKGRFLIVMDDVWTADDWNKLRATLPMSNSNGKLLITSRQMEVGNAANPHRSPHELRFLTEKESWELLQLEVFHKRESPPELTEYGDIILKKCNGLPLAIVVIGGILSKRVSATDLNAMITMWKKISENVNINIDTEDVTKRMEKIIALSYDKLPYYLRACFLYLGMFPEDFEIPSWRLTQMWIAEGFIQRKDNISLEESAENHLEFLIDRNLLRVHKRRRNGKVKTCRIHDMIRDFCKTEAGNESFLQEIRKSREQAFDPPAADVFKFRRICIHYNVVNFLSSDLYGPKVRSFVCFSDNEVDLPMSKNSVIPASFKLLRVLEVQPIKFSQVPKGIHHLLHLRFVSISLNLDNLPSIFSKLWNIQTLVVNTKHRTLNIKADIWKMKRLRNFKTNASATLPTAGKLETCEIKTLGTISPESCTENLFDRASYLKKLSIRGRLSLLLEAKNESFNNIEKLDCLEKLKLINDAFPDPTSNNPLRCLPPAKRFPPSLKRLTLSDTYLEWCEMSVLGQIKNLEVLKLLEKAFVGTTWEAIDGEFLTLKVLYISRTDLVKWIATQYHFPNLGSLELWFCDELIQIPEDLAKISKFQTLKIERCKFAAAFTQKFRDNKEKQSSTFKLSIFPPLSE